MPVRSSRPALAATRRTTIAAAAAVSLAGCRFGPPDDEPDHASTTKPDADASLVDEAVQAILQPFGMVHAAAEDHRGLASALAPLVAMHQEHLALLDAHEFTLATRTPIGQRASDALTEIRKAEQRLQTTLADLASRATSGTFARALASMSAAVAQQVAVLPELARGAA